MRIYELKEKDDAELLTEIKGTLSAFPILREIYDEDFYLDLLKKKFCNDNYLLWLLASRTDYSRITWESISKCLNLLKEAESISHFRDKLRLTDERFFHCYQTELELAGYYKERGNDIELEPQISETNKNPDFKIKNEDIQIYFEIGNLFTDKLIEMQRLDSHLYGMFGKIEELFVFSISYQPNVLKIRHLKHLDGFLRKIFAELDKKEKIFPFTCVFPNQKYPLAEVKIWGRPNKLKYGYLASVMSGAFGLPRGGINFRRKISKKISQLPKNASNVMVIELGHIYYDEEDLIDSLFGDESFVVNKEDFSAHAVRGREKIFSANKNTRLSAVLYYRKKFGKSGFHVWKTVFHNPFASNPIIPDFFEDNNVKQFVPIKDEKGCHMEWLKNESN